MKNFKVLALTAFLSLVAAPALAGETYVRNEWSDTHSVTDTDLYLDSTTKSIRLEVYNSYADKTYVDGDSGYYYYADEEYTEHNAGSELWGVFAEKINSHVYGTISTHSVTNSNYHETSSGVR